ncbi:Panacea domain-containing protein [Bacillus smithii]|uniref:Panacea domain-containing protein n=1 Tax=Bacillus smithii TaxID=1479 RepID=UPI002E1DD109|nr:DUF4065 domain-containing protein [Bacillus smithii]MED4929005.1 DUF4065 domain-containing protein [Bacillus smithii]
MNPYAAIDVANYIVKKSMDDNKPISNLKLQKILYYLQARFLVEDGRPLFSDKIEKWKYGPVTPSTYHEFKRFGSGAINSIADQLVVDKDDQGKIINVRIKKFDENEIDKADRQKIDDTFQKLRKYGAFDLVEMTHEQTLWSNFKDDILNNKPVDPYKNEEIKSFFEKNPEEQIWKNK